MSHFARPKMSFTSQNKSDISSSSMLSSSILRPSVLSNKLPSVNVDVTTPFQSTTKLEKPLVDPPTFKPAGPASTSTRLTSAPGYVFGQNMSSRVVNAPQGASENIWQAVKSGACDTDNNQDNTGDSVFTTLAKVVTKSTDSKVPVHLEESAVALARKRNAAQIALPSNSSGEPHEITTGEEDERTVLELTCNSYVFNRDSTQWTPIGQSYLHLNDATQSSASSRLIIRLQSTRRVVVNTRIWSEMPVAYVAENKAVRIGAMTVAGQNDVEGSIRTYMLRFATTNLALTFFESLEERKNHAEKLDMVVKRPRVDESQESTEGGSISCDSAFSETNRKTPTQEDQISDPHTIALPLPAACTKSGCATVLSLPCQRVRLYDASNDLLEDVEAQGVSVQITDYPPNGPAVLEVTAPNGAGESLLTVAVGLRLAFCQIGDAEVHVFVVAASEDQTEQEGSLKKSCHIQLASSSDADRLYRSLLLRVNRLFMESSGLLKEPEESSRSQSGDRTIDIRTGS
uniref:RanBD1 domain-containing protein n=1 Tax=Mesocestoides corti TaxID=53468 RepID=A0A5K3EZR9_MESCO